MGLPDLACWLMFGMQKSEPRLIALGAAGVTASTLVGSSTRRPDASPPDCQSPSVETSKTMTEMLGDPDRLQSPFPCKCREREIVSGDR